MAYDFFGTSSDSSTVLTIDGPTVELPDASYIRDAAMQRDGMDLVLDGPQGTITVEGYFAAENAPDLTADGGLVLTPKLVNSFVSGGDEYAQSASMNDVSPVGAVDEINGDATITRTDGSVEKIAMGTHVFQGDVIETSGEGAVNITFIDDTSFAVSNNARLAVDEYVFDPATESGSQNFSVLKGVFVFTSGLVGRDDPDDVNIDMPSGSIGIRGTIIAGDADTGEVTVIEGAIVVRDNLDNEVTLDDRFETAKIDSELGDVVIVGQLDADNVSDRFDTLSNVSPTLFSSIEDAAAEQVVNPEAPVDEIQDSGEPTPTEENFDADGTVDGDGDTDVDGTIDESTLEPKLDLNDGTLEDSAEILTTETKETLIQNTLGTDPIADGSGTLKASLQEAVESGDITLDEAKAIMVNLQSDSLTTEQKIYLKATLSDDPDAVRVIGEKLALNDSGGGNIIPIFIRDAQLSSEPGFGADQRFGPGQTNQANNEYFQVTSNEGFGYNIWTEFADPGDTLTFTISNVSTVSAPPIVPNLTSGGFLSFSTTTFSVDGSLSFDVTATDSVGNTNTQRFTINLIAPTNQESGAGGLGPINNDTLHYTFSDPTVNLGIGGSFNVGTVHLGDGPDILNMVNANGNDIYLGFGTNTVNVSQSGTNSGNTIYGGHQNDTFNLQYTLGGGTTANFSNTFYGMDGSDTFVMQVDGNMSFSNLSIKGGSATVAGDTLQFDANGGGPGILNFANISGIYTPGSIDGTNNIHGIENIDLTGTSGVFMSLSTDNVFQFTDFVNTLQISGDGNDRVDLAGFTDTGNDLSGFSVYTGVSSGSQSVTLLVEDTIGTVNVM